MPITNYSVLAGDPVSGKVVDGRSAHYQIAMQAEGGPFTVAVNIESVDGSEVLYAIKQGFTPPDAAGLLALPLGMHALGGSTAVLPPAPTRQDRVVGVIALVRDLDACGHGTQHDVSFPHSSSSKFRVEGNPEVTWLPKICFPLIGPFCPR